MAMILLSIGTKFTDFTPDLIFPETMMATWMVPIFSACIFVVPLLIFLKLINKYKLGLVELVKFLLGNFLGNIICLFLFLFSLIGTALLLNNYASILSTLYFNQSPKELFQILLAITCCLMALGGAYGLGRTAWIVLPYVKFALLILIILTFTIELDISYLFPFFGKGIDVLVKESFLKNSIFIECFFLATLVPFMKKSSDYSRAAIISLIIVAVEMSVFFIFYIIVFDAYALTNMALPFQHLTRTVNLGRFISNFEGYFLAFWIVGSLLKYAVYIYTTALIFTQTLHVKSTKFHIFPVTILVVLIGMVPENAIRSSFLYREYTLHVGSLFFVIFPFILWILSIRKKVSVTL